jgi:hypothetical protein
MALPHTVRVKLSSEAAESISLTPVVVQEMAIRDLVEHMLGVTGKDEARIRELLLRGSLVSGASRFRWAGWDQDAESLRALLAAFPDPDPTRPVAYAGYSYRERTDRYTRPITPSETERIRAAAESVKYSTLRDQIRTAAFLAAELHASRT